MLNRFLATVLVGASSLLCSSSANAWHHHHHHSHYYGGYGGYGLGYGFGSYYPSGFGYYSSPWYSSFSFNTGYWPRYRAFHHYRPYYSSYQVYSSPYYYSSYYPTTYYAPTYYSAPACQPVIQSYYTPTYNVAPTLDCCSTTNGSGVIQSSGAIQSEISTPVDPQLQIRNVSKSQYLIADKAEWVDTAVELIDQMAASGGLAEAEEACNHLITVRTNVPASIHLRAGLLALHNGKSFDVAATHFEQAAATQQIETTTAELSSQFASALQLDQYAQWEPQIQLASKKLLGDTNSNSSKIRLISDRSDSDATSETPTIRRNNDAQVVLDAVLRVNGQSAKADQISQAIERLPNL